MLDAKLLKPLSCMKTNTALRARYLSGLSRNGSIWYGIVKYQPRSQGLSSSRPSESSRLGGKMRDPGNEVG